MDDLLQVPPTCVTRWQDGRLAVAERLQVATLKAKTAADRRSKCTLRSSRTHPSITSARFSTFSGHGASMSKKSADKSADHVHQLAEDAYLQLCAASQVKANSGIQRHLAGLTCDEGSALLVFDANRNHLGKNGLKIVLDLVAANQRMHTLLLAQQGITSDALTDLLEVLRDHDGLRYVDLSHNPLSITAARMLADFAAKTQTVERIDLQETHITEEWRERIASRLREGASKRRQGLVVEPVYRSACTHCYVYVTLLLSDHHSLADECSLLDDAFQKMNTVLEVRGCTLSLLRVNDAHLSSNLPAVKSAVDQSRDAFNWGIPWVVGLFDPSRDSTGNAAQGAGVSVFGAALAYVHEVLEGVPPHPPACDKNGVHRDPLREHVPGVVLFEKRTKEEDPAKDTDKQAPQKGQQAQQQLPPVPPASADTSNLFAALSKHRLVRASVVPADYLPKVLESELLSRILVAVERVYPAHSSSDDWDEVAASAQQHYPPQQLTAAELYACPKRPPFFRTHWFAADQLLQNYQPRQATQQELLSYCEHYEPESGVTYPLLVYGQAGVGKATLLAWLARQLLRESEAAVLPVFIGTGGNTVALRDVLRGLILAVREAFEMQPLQFSLQEHCLAAEWRDLVTQSTTYRPRKVVILLSGLEHLERDADTLLPVSLNAYVRIVATVSSHVSLLPLLRKRVPQPYEVLLSTLPREECMSILNHRLRCKIPGLDVGGGASQADEGVISEPSNPADAVCFKDHGGTPLYLIVLAELLSVLQRHCTDEATTLEAIRKMPETTHGALDALLAEWEHIFGAVSVQLTLTFIYLRKEGFSMPELEGTLRDDAMEWDADTPFSPASLSLFWAALRPLLLRHGDGMFSPLHPAMSRAIQKRYRLDEAPTEKLDTSMASYSFKVLSSKFSSPFLQRLALAALPRALLRAGRVLDAHSVVTDTSYVERQVQADLQQLVSDCEAVEAEFRRCSEAGIEGFSFFQFRPCIEISILRAVRSMCIDYESVLRWFPSVLQLAVTLPASNLCRKAAEDHLEANGLPHPLLRWVNRVSRPSLASSSVQVADTPVLHVAFSPLQEDGLMYAATTSAAVFICSLQDVVHRLSAGDSLSAPQDGFLSSVFTPDGAMLVTSAATQVLVWLPGDDVPLLHNILEYAPSITRPLSCDGGNIVAVQLATGKGAVIDTRKGRVISTLQPHVDDEPIRNIFYAQGTPVVVSVGLGAICIYSGTSQVAYRGHEGLVSCCDVSSDGKLGASADGMTVHIWSAQTGIAIKVLNKHPSIVNDVAFHPNGHLVTTCDTLGNVLVWTGQGQEAVREPLQTGIGAAHWVGFTPDGCSLIIRSDAGFHTFETSTFTSKGVLGGSQGRITYITAASDATTVATADEDGSVQCFALDEQQNPTSAMWLDRSVVLVPTENIKSRCDAHTHGVLDIAFSPDGRDIATVFGNGTLKMWSAASGDASLCVEGEGYVSATFIPNSGSLILGRLSTLRVINFRTGEVLLDIPAFRGLIDEEDGTGVRLLRLSPDGQTLACTMRSAKDVSLVRRGYLFHLPTRRRVGAALGHRDEVTGMEYIGSDIATCSRDGTLRLWCSKAQSERQQVVLPAAAESLSVQGVTAVVGLANGAVGVFVHDACSKQLVVKLSVSAGSPVQAVHLLEPLGHIAVAVADQFLNVYSLSTGQCLASVSTHDVPRSIASHTRVSHGQPQPPRILVGGSSGFVYWLDFFEKDASKYITAAS